MVSFGFNELFPKAYTRLVLMYAYGRGASGDEGGGSSPLAPSSEIRPVPDSDGEIRQVDLTESGKAPSISGNFPSSMVS